MKSRSILFKSRLYVTVLVALCCAALMAEWTRLVALQHEISTLVSSTAPHLARTSELARVGSSLRAESNIVQTTATLKDLSHSRQALQHLMTDAIRLLRVSDFPKDFRHEDIDTFDSLLVAQTDFLIAQNAIEANAKVALEALNTLSSKLLPNHQELMLAVLELERNRSLKQQNLHGFEDFLAISEMKISISRLSILVGAISRTETQRVDTARAVVVQEIGVLASRLTRLGNATLRVEAALELSRLHDALIGQHGLLRAVDALDTATLRRRNALTNASAFVDRITSQLSEVSQATADGFQAVAVDTARDIQRLFWLKLTLTLVSVATVTLFAVVVIERGLIARLSDLTGHVRRVAQGQFDVPVPVRATDEVGEIEQAVERSRRIALDLKQSNDELERFAYVAAHDLRSPLRAVSDLVAWTKEDYGAELPEGAQSNLNLIEGRMARVSSHLTALLDYARAGRDEAHTSVLNLDAFAEDLREMSLHGVDFELHVTGDLRVFEAHIAPVKTILLNLVSNAVKHHDGETGRIEVSCKRDGAWAELIVADDGPGISPEYHARIFDLFQTLRARDDIESTGLGLALVQKLAASLGGTVSVVSDPQEQRGTSFVVRLPLAGNPKHLLTPHQTIGGLAA